MKDRQYVKLVNLTGHELMFANRMTLGSTGQARVRGEMRTVERLHYNTFWIPMLEVTERTIDGLPEPVRDTVYIVSGIVAAAAQREDVVAPGRVRRGRDGRPDQAGALVRPRPRL